MSGKSIYMPGETAADTNWGGGTTTMGDRKSMLNSIIEEDDR